MWISSPVLIIASDHNQFRCILRQVFYLLDIEGLISKPANHQTMVDEQTNHVICGSASLSSSEQRVSKQPRFLINITLT